MNYERAEKIANFIKSKTTKRADVAIVLGSGLSSLCEDSKIDFSISYNDIPDFPCSTVEGHRGNLIFAESEGRDVIFMQGRVHYYEGYTVEEVVMPFIVLKLLGVKTVILTNSAGGINKKFVKGDLMQITDHITSFVPSPLIGKNSDKYGERFPDMTEVYDAELVSLIESVGRELKIELQKGIYLQTGGPNFETPAEISMYGILGADAVGMSTACEAMVCHYLSMKVAGISLISNKASGLSECKLTHAEVLESGRSAAQKLGLLLKRIIVTI